MPRWPAVAGNWSGRTKAACPSWGSISELWEIAPLSSWRFTWIVPPELAFAERGLLASVDVARHMLLVRRILGGRPRKVLHLRASVLISLDQESCRKRS